MMTSSGDESAADADDDDEHIPLWIGVTLLISDILILDSSCLFRLLTIYFRSPKDPARSQGSALSLADCQRILMHFKLRNSA